MYTSYSQIVNDLQHNMTNFNDYIYLDHSATTPIHPEVYAAMEPFMTKQFGNASSLHTFGRQARNAIEIAREQVANLIGSSRSSEIVFTSGATESNNQAIKGIIAHHRQKNPNRNLHIVTCVTEHHAVLHSCHYLEKQGLTVTYLPVDRYGRVSLNDLKTVLCNDTVLVSMMYVNNEIGTIHPIDEICEIAKKSGVSVHSDAVQAIGKIPINVDKLKLDFLSISAHKFNGPKGIGCLYLQRRQRIGNLLHGGEHERNRRAGTENVSGIVGLGKAAELRKNNFSEVVRKTTEIRDLFEAKVLKMIPNSKVNGNIEHRSGNSTNILFEGIDGQALVIRLDQIGIRCSQSSACTNMRPEPSYVLRAMGLSEEEAYSSIRFSFSEDNTLEEVDIVVEALSRLCEEIRPISKLLSKTY